VSGHGRLSPGPARLAGLGALAGAASVPDLAAACATCTSSAFGDLTFSWPHLVLLVLPLLVAGTMGSVIVYCYRRGGADPAVRDDSAPLRPGDEAAVEASSDDRRAHG
jgi:hypothetical protein